LLIGAVVLVTLACGGGGDENGNAAPGAPTTPTPPATTEFDFLIGTWRGNWADTRFGVNGTLEATFTVSGNDVSANGTIGLQSLGLGNEQGSGTGTIDGDTLTFTFEAATVGEGEGALEDGRGSGTGSVLGTLAFGDFSFEGTATETTIEGTFEFTAPSGGRGEVSLTKQ
jgi:hypothetical protein